MKNFEEWKKEYLKKNPNSDLTDWELRTEFANYVPPPKEYVPTPKKVQKSAKVNHKSSPSLEPSSTKQIEDKLDKLYDVMNHIRWIGLSIGCMFALTFIVPQCTGG